MKREYCRALVFRFAPGLARLKTFMFGRWPNRYRLPPYDPSPSQPDCLSASAVRSVPLRVVQRIPLFFMATLLLVVSGCHPNPTAPPGIQKITREIVRDVRKATGGRAEVTTHSDYAARQAGSEPVVTADYIYLRVPPAPGGRPDTAARDAIAEVVARVAQRHHLQRDTVEAASETQKIDLIANKQRTHHIEIVALGNIVATASRPPRLAIVIDDLGGDAAQANAIFRLSYPLTLSVLPYLAHSGNIAEQAHSRGYHVMLHLPIASTAGKKEEPIELHPGMNSDVVGRTFAGMLGSVPYAAGVNNHEGSLGTSDRALMDELMPQLRQRNLFFIDSRTTAASVAETAAHDAGVPTASRNVFLDDEQRVAPIRKQFELAIRSAKEKGSAVAIGHPHPETLRVLAEMLPEAQHQGVTLVYASDLVQ
jgi:polysaccharide deacetylase 2 family uncharacterized protein YibQ